MELVHFLSDACLPAKIYLAITFVNFFVFLLVDEIKARTFTILSAFVLMLLIGLGMTWFGNYLCSNGFEVVTWLLVLIPFLAFVRNLRLLIKTLHT